ncbi:piwi-like protein 4 [Rana temporaria]|uniref:piwi-like protein 4 n=1 Tax=Rana temporaria TaxID=8407 RepID=UPI001AAE14A0|nr:piwi-like protein 4 [Rana temporaria]
MSEPPSKRKLLDNGSSSAAGSSRQSISGDDDSYSGSTISQLSAGDGRTVVAERGRRLSRNLQDLGVYTRQTMAHVVDRKTGSSGSPVKLLSNLFALGFPKEWQLFQYHVDYKPSIASIRMKVALLYTHKDVIGQSHAFDGAMLYLSRKLQDKVTELTSTTKHGEEVKITLTLTSILPAGSPTCIQFFGVLFKRIFRSLNMYQVGRNYYNPSNPVEIPQHKLMLWPGFSISIMHLENQLTLSADISHKVLRNETVLNFMTDLYSKVPEERFTEACEKEFLGMIVLTRYNNKTYRVDDIDWNTKPSDTFPKKDGSVITYVDYYKQQYNLELTDLFQPMLVSTMKVKKKDATDVPRAVHLIPELCYLTGLSTRALTDFRLMKDLAMETQVNPERRQQRLQSLASNIEGCPAASLEMKKWGMRLEKQISLTGRVIPPERICMRDNVCQPMSAADWGRDTRDSRMITAEPLNNWLLLFSRRSEDVVENLVYNLQKVGSGMGFSIEQPKIVKVDESTAAFTRALQQLVHQDLQMVFCILPSISKDNYDSIKKFLSVEMPIPSQCVQSRTLSKQHMLMSIASKIAMQMICKMGGELWAVEIPLKSLMVVGIDVSKDAMDKSRSVVGFVASTNARLTKWFSRCIIQKTSTNFADCLTVCMQGAIEKWKKNNNDWPSRIIIYRDGVGDGQLQMVVDYEIPQLLACFTQFLKTYSPKMTFVVVRKRCTTRFFSEAGRGLQNPPLGTVVDSVATRREWYDFFLISQNARQGTVNPTYYNVLYDSNCLKPDHLQRLTYKLCHLYYNWPGVVRVPAPCQYAYKLTSLVGQSIHREPSIELSNTLFYL